MIHNPYKYDYQIGISYASADLDVAVKFKTRLQMVLGNGVFRDRDRPEEFNSSPDLAKDLHQFYYDKIRYALIIYSDKYEKARFTLPEYRALAKRREEKDPDLEICIINLSNHEVHLDGLTKGNYTAFDRNCPDEKYDEQIWAMLITFMKKSLINLPSTPSSMDCSAPPHIDLTIRAKADSRSEAVWDKNSNWTFLLSSFFDGQTVNLSPGYTWKDVIAFMRLYFIKAKIYMDEFYPQGYELLLTIDGHLSLAFLAGKIYGNPYEKPNKRLLLAGSRSNDTLLVSPRAISAAPLDIKTEILPGNSPESNNVLFLLNITKNSRDITKDVLAFCENDFLRYRAIHSVSATFTIDDGTQLGAILDAVIQFAATNSNTGDVLHLFAATTTSLMFVLGGHSRFLGEVNLYEFDMGKRQYSKSFTYHDYEEVANADKMQ